ncbi:hypothetical protein SDC9_40628 [bioreactor metagenome]|uniref:DUF1573 domain-containing protein n=1 Tax=bioreactor metagenome TaxID=1076179 RepID=A0A644VSU1_9ZZZZ
MKAITISITFLIIITKIFGQDTCLKITRLTPYDTVTEADYIHRTVFLIESLKDTVEIERFASSCGCEVPHIAHGIIYPSYPDTIYVESLLLGRPGPYHKSTYLKTKSGCFHSIFTDFYVSNYPPPTNITIERFSKENLHEYSFVENKNDWIYDLLVNNIGMNNLVIKDIRSTNPDIIISSWDSKQIKTGNSGWLRIYLQKTNTSDRLSIEIIYNANQKLIWSED